MERAAALLRDACGMSDTEVAQTMDVPLGTAKTCARLTVGAAIADSDVP